MGLSISLGHLGQLWAVRCCECKDLKVIEGPVTKVGALHAMENHGYAEGPKGWICPPCRTVSLKRR